MLSTTNTYRRNYAPVPSRKEHDAKAKSLPKPIRHYTPTQIKRRIPVSLSKAVPDVEIPVGSNKSEFGSFAFGSERWD